MRLGSKGREDRCRRPRWFDESEFAVARFTANGKLDRYLRLGRRGADAYRGDDVPDEGAIEPDGKIVVAGSTADADFALVRYTPSGKLDRGFGTGGRS